MKPRVIERRLQEIANAAREGDYRRARELEDLTRDEVLEAIASTYSLRNARELAACMLRSRDVDYPRSDD